MTAICVPTCSRSRRDSILQNPNTAFTGVPSGRVIGGKAWKARKMNPDPSIRIRCRASEAAGGGGLLSATDAAIPPGLSAATSAGGMSMIAVVIGSRVQDVKARAVRADDLLVCDAQEDPGMAEGAFASIAGDRAGVDVDNLGRCHLRACRLGWSGLSGAFRHRGPLSGRGTGVMIAMRRMLSTVIL